MKVFEFSNYKRFLRDFINQQPRKGRGLVKAMAEHLTVNGSAVSQVLSGEKDFSEEQALQISRFIGLMGIEADYFITLVKIERAGSKDLKDYWREKLASLKTGSLDLSKRMNQDRVLSDYEKSVFYSSYLYSAVRMSSSIRRGVTISEISERFELTREKSAEILGFLSEIGLCRNEGGRFTVGTQHTHIERGSPFLARHHHNWRVKALQKTETLTEQELQFTSPVSINEKDFLAVREILTDSAKQMMEKVKAGEPSGVACLLMDWFWVNK